MSAFISSSVKETYQIAFHLVKFLKIGDLLALCGPLGAGKTVFVQGMGKALNLDINITSPTFIIINKYLGKFPLYHLDFYRLETKEELLELGIKDYLPSANGLSVVEWADKFLDIFPDEYLRLDLSVLENEKRKISFEPRGAYYQRLLARFKKSWQK